MIDDPLAQFDPEELTPEATPKDPVTGLREPIRTSSQRKLKQDEIERKKLVSTRVLSHLLSDEFGREWLYDLLVTCNVFGTPYTMDPQATAYNAGALYIGRIIEASTKETDIKSYFRMCEEGIERERIWNEQLVGI